MVEAIAKTPLCCGVFLSVSLWGVASTLANAEPPSFTTSKVGGLNIVGDGVRRLALWRIEGDPNDPDNTPVFQASPRSIVNSDDPANQVILERPGKTVLLPLGKYTLTGVELDGGFQCIVPSVYFDIDTGAPRARGRERTEFVIRPDKPCTIKVGTPFKPTVIATRRDASLLLEYRLTDAGGHTYFCSEWDKPPAKLVDGRIVSGQQMFAEERSERMPRFVISRNGQEIDARSCDFSHAGNFWHVWRVPPTILEGPLSIVASFDLGAHGPRETEPITVEWHWHYQVWPHHAGWILIIALLILVEANRSWQAGLILAVFYVLCEVFVPWYARSDRMSRQETAFLSAIIAAWTAAWLLSPWLAKLRPIVALALVLAMSLMIGVVQGFWFEPALLFRPLSLIGLVMGFFPLPVAFALSALCCQRKYRLRRFMLWLMLWLVVAFAVGCVAMCVGNSLWGEDLRHRDFSDFIFILVVAPLVFGIVAYGLNLPFMLLTLLCRTYRERFHRLLRLEHAAVVVPAAPAVAP